MPDDNDVGAGERMQSDLAGEPLSASVQDILDEHADAARRADDERKADEAERERVERRKLDERQSALHHAGGERRVRPRRTVDVRTGGERGHDASSPGAELDPRLLVGGALLGVILAGGVRRVLLVGAVAAAGWLLYRRVLEPAGDPGMALQ